MWPSVILHKFKCQCIPDCSLEKGKETLNLVFVIRTKSGKELGGSKLVITAQEKDTGAIAECLNIPAQCVKQSKWEQEMFRKETGNKTKVSASCFYLCYILLLS